MTARLGSTVGLLVVAIGLAACGGASADDPDRPLDGSQAKEVTAAAKPSQPATDPAPAAKTGIRIKARQSEYGTILVTGAGRTIYLFDKEKRPEERVLRRLRRSLAARSSPEAPRSPAPAPSRICSARRSATASGR